MWSLRSPEPRSSSVCTPGCRTSSRPAAKSRMSSSAAWARTSSMWTTRSEGRRAIGGGGGGAGGGAGGGGGGRARGGAPPAGGGGARGPGPAGPRHDVRAQRAVDALDHHAGEPHEPLVRVAGRRGDQRPDAVV